MADINSLSFSCPETFLADQAGKALSNAIVSLAYQGLNYTTGADGMYLLTNVTADIKQPMLPGTERVSLKKGSLELVLSKPS